LRSIWCHSLNRGRVCHGDRHRRRCQKPSDQKADATENTHSVFPIPAEVKRGNSDPIVNISSRRKKALCPPTASRRRGPLKKAPPAIISDAYCGALSLIMRMSRGDERGGVKKGKIMRRTVCAFTVATLICAAGYETSHAAPIAPLTRIQAGSGNITLVSSHHYRRSRRYIVIPLTRDYGWWPQGQYRWFPFGQARWGYWCEPASYYRLSCGVGD